MVCANPLAKQIANGITEYPVRRRSYYFLFLRRAIYIKLRYVIFRKRKELNHSIVMKRTGKNQCVSCQKSGNTDNRLSGLGKKRFPLLCQLVEDLFDRHAIIRHVDTGTHAMAT